MSFLNTVGKKLAREQEKLRQKMTGEEAKDADGELMKVYSDNLQKQTEKATKLAEEAKKYHLALAAAAEASKSFCDAIKQVYEPDWTGSEAAYTVMEGIHLINKDMLEKLSYQVVEPLQQYLVQFPIVKARLDKRNRRIVDYDRTKHSLASARELTGPKAPAKIQEALAEYQTAASKFDDINKEVHAELPTFHHKRIHFYASLFENYFHSESVYHKGYDKAVDELRGFMNAIDKESERMPEWPVPAPRLGNEKADDHHHGGDDDDDAGDLKRRGTNTAAKPSPARPTPAATKPAHAEGEKVAAAAAAPEAGAATAKAVRPPRPVPTKPADEPAPAAPEPPGQIELRIATHPYDGQDDELTFKKGDIIRVFPFPDPEDQDEGWLYGKTADNQAGPFPVNFTTIFTLKPAGQA